MTNQILLLLTASFLVTCCRGEQPADTSPIRAGDPLYTDRAVRFFSDEKYRDTLSVTANGETLITGQVYLKLVQHTGKVIFRDSFPATDLISHDGPIDPEKDKTQIRTRLDSFFASTHFFRPANAFSQQVTLPDSIRAVWKAVEADPKATYFLYPARKNTLTGIAYSKSSRRVITSTGQ